jgi:hypothetical protein
MKPRVGLISALKVVAIVAIVCTSFIVGINVLALRFVETVSIASYSSPAGLGDVVFIRYLPLFTDTYMAIDLTPGEDGDEFIIGHVECGDGHRFMGAVKSKDGTVIAVRTTAGYGNLSYKELGGQFPFTHAYDFKNKSMIVAPYRYEDGVSKPWNDRAIKILKLLEERGGVVPLIEDKHQLEYDRLSFSQSKRWREMITEFQKQE